MMNRILGMTLLAAMACTGGAARAADFVWVEKGVAKAPIIVASNAPPATLQAAGDLADYVKKISGVRPPLLTGCPDPMPAKAVWIGLQSPMAQIFPAVNFDFQYPEEILYACNGRHLLIAGRDRMAGESQIEYGTANAVYDFIEKKLGVRWLWPGELGEDIVRSDTISLPPFEVRYHPLFRQRDIWGLGMDGGLLDWARVQRIALDSFSMDIGHAFVPWWDRFHQTHPDYFALQPDGTRSGYPGSHDAKLCEANPAVWAQWLDDAGTALRDPRTSVIGAAPNDASGCGICMCDRCRAWDHPDGAKCLFIWSDRSEEYVAMSDRYVTFWNHLARGLRERFPERDAWVSGLAYGPARDAPIAAIPASNVVIGYVGHFPTASDALRKQEKARWREWSAKAKHMVFRPNVFYYSGGLHALPAIALSNTLDDFRFLAEHNGVGLNFDGTPQHWAVQGPQYYLMAKLAWDPLQDGKALLEDYYRRGFGPAAQPVREYFDLMEAAHRDILNAPAWRAAMGATREPLTGLILAAYHAERMTQAAILLDRAASLAESASPTYRERVAFVRTGLDFARLVIDTLKAMERVRKTGGSDTAAVERALALSQARPEFFRRHHGLAIAGHAFESTFVAGRGLSDYLGPPSETFFKASGLLKVYRWTGRQGDDLWTSAGNWDVQSGTNWAPAGEPPMGTAHVILGDATGDDKPQRLLLSRDISIGRLTMKAGGARAYTIASREDPVEDRLDSNSGMIYGLRIADDLPIEQSSNATQSLSLQVETRLTSDGEPTIRLSSATGAAVVMDRPLRAEKRLIVTGSKGGSGLLEWRARAVVPMLQVSGGAQLFFTHTGEAGFRHCTIAGTVLAGSSVTLAEGLNQGPGTACFRLRGAGTNDVSVDVGDLTRGGEIRLLGPADESTGRLILKVRTIDSRAGGSFAPTVRTEAGTFVDLGGDQPGPMRADLAAGIHGAGGLIKSRAASLGPISKIGERNTYTGGTFIESGTLQLTGGAIPANRFPGATNMVFNGQLGPGPLHIGSAGVFDLNGLSQTVATLSGEGTILLNRGTLAIVRPNASSFKGTMKGPGTLVEGETKRVLNVADQAVPEALPAARGQE